MKKKYWFYAGLPALGLLLLGTGIASAHGFGGGMGMGMGFGNNLTPAQISANQQSMFQKEADILGISLDDVKTAWAKGENLQQLAQDHGITQAQLTQKIQDARIAEIKTQLQNLVSGGVITQAQADQRLQFMQNLQTNNKGRGHMGMMGLGF